MKKLLLLSLLTTNAFAGAPSITIAVQDVQVAETVTSAKEQYIPLAGHHIIHVINNDGVIRNVCISYAICATNETCRYYDTQKYVLQPYGNQRIEFVTHMNARYHYAGNYQYSSRHDISCDAHGSMERGGTIKVY